MRSRADPNQRDKFGRTALFAAVINAAALANERSAHQSRCIELLLKGGCCSSCLDAHGLSIMDYLWQLHIPEHEHIKFYVPKPKQHAGCNIPAETRVSSELWRIVRSAQACSSRLVKEVAALWRTCCNPSEAMWLLHEAGLGEGRVARHATKISLWLQLGDEDGLGYIILSWPGALNMVHDMVQVLSQQGRTALEAGVHNLFASFACMVTPWCHIIGIFESESVRKKSQALQALEVEPGFRECLRAVDPLTGRSALHLAVHMGHQAR